MRALTGRPRAGWGGGTFLFKSNPNNPTGRTVQGADLKEMVDFAMEPNRGGLFDEA